MSETVDLVLEFAGEKIGVAIPPAPDLTPYEKTVVVDRKLSELLGTEKPKAPGDATEGTATTVSREDHVHPVQKDIEGNAGTATKLAEARSIALTGAATGLPASFDGSQNIVIAVTTLDATKLTGTASVDTTGNAATASKWANARSLSLSGAVSGSASFDGSGNIAITTTSNIVGLQLGNTVGQAPGTASAGTASTAARSDHVHPLQTTVSGNAGTATKLQTSRTISLSGAVSGSGSFDGSGNLAITTTSNGLQLGNTVGSSPGTAAVGTATTAARSDHVHPLQTYVTGNAGTATKLATARTITLSGDCSGSTSFDGSGNVTITTTVVNGGVQLGSTAPKAAGTAAAGTASTAARSDHVHPLQTTVSGNAGTATKLATARTIALSGVVSGSASFDGSGNVTITTTGGSTLQLGNTTGSAPGTASAGSASTAARSDHVHPLQTTVSGNAGTATKLATARTITVAGAVSGSASFDGGSAITITTTSNISSVALASTVPVADGATAATGSATTAARADHRHLYPDTVLNGYASGVNIKFWCGPEASLPASRSSDTVYFVY